jgi:hypothetical protein
MAELATRVVVDVERSFGQSDGQVSLYVLRGWVAANGRTTTSGEALNHDYSEGERRLLFVRSVPHPELETVRILTAGFANVLLHDTDDVEGLWALLSELQADRNAEALSRAADVVVEAEYVGRSTVDGELRVGVPSKYFQLELRVLEGPDELRAMPSTTVACSFLARSPIGPYSCDVGMVGVEPGDTVLVGLCWDDAIGYYSCQGGWSILHKLGGVWLHGLEGTGGVQ